MTGNSREYSKLASSGDDHDAESSAVSASSERHESLTLLPSKSSSSALPQSQSASAAGGASNGSSSSQSGTSGHTRVAVPSYQHSGALSSSAAHHTSRMTCGQRLRLATRNKLFLLSMVLLVSTITLAALLANTMSRGESTAPRNLVVMISDGYGPAQATMGRLYYNLVVKGRNLTDTNPSLPLPLDTFAVGASRTRSSSSLVTDSAAGATAYACRKKAVNGYVGVDSLDKPCGTLMEAAIARGMRTGVVVTSRITHATPASFTSHVLDRDNEALIAVQQLGTGVDLYMGGGRCYFTPQSASGSCRTDDFDGLQNATARGYHVLLDRAGFDAVRPVASSLPILGLFAKSHMNYEIDRNPSQQPSLAEMVTKAIAILEDATKDSDQGFMLLVEGSRIDMAGHDNDPATEVRDILAYQDAVQVVKQYAQKNPNTLVVSTSDHETGGMTLGVQTDYLEYPEYEWTPYPLQRQLNSTEVLAKAIRKLYDDGGNVTDYLVSTVLPVYLGIPSWTESDIQAILDGLQLYIGNGSDFYLKKPLNILVSNAAGIGWTTPGHSGVDVNLYAMGSSSSKIVGNLENTQVGQLIEEIFSFDLDAITKKVA
ncbi:alkaline phosphatase [Capsaspora owczarzaki ATCC 30864]|uniref:Alkaline phosphatase n=2 Tax=Capsaspora owczarzaki (strain ATCC 30864) TaxID=595528 RepID=A0A0D2WXT5_CAPO3|nr:alkaline phosphatase [Capsaspora owczarzaki ATCC 30864]